MEEIGSRFKLKICVDNTNSDDEGSESGQDESDSVTGAKHSPKISGDEISRDRNSDEDETISVYADTDKPKVSEKRIKTYKNKAGTFVMGFDPTSQECREKQKQRAKRFGNEDCGALVTDEAIQKLYESLGVSSSSGNENGGFIRFDAIHLCGVDEMSTTRVFDYFGEFAPSAIEWIDDTSCNVVWSDKVEAARALLKLSSDPTSSNDNGVSISEVELHRDVIDKDGLTVESSENSLKTEEQTLFTGNDDDDLNLLSDDDVAKLSHSTVTAEENMIKVAERQLSEDRGLASKAKPVETVCGEEDMEVDDFVDSSSRDMKQPDRRSSSSSEKVDMMNERKKRKRITMKDDPPKMPSGNWRIGQPHPRAKHLFMRFATTADIKKRGAGKRSKYYQKYGNPSFGGMKGLISGSRKRKIFSKKYEDELEEARKAIEEAKWKRGVPAETKFDQHVEDATFRRSKPVRETVQPISSGEESDDSSNKLIVEADDRSVRQSPKKKRFMKMHADVLEERSLSERLGVRNHKTSESSNVRDRLGITSEPSWAVHDSRNRNSSRQIGDLRNRLSRR